MENVKKKKTSLLFGSSSYQTPAGVFTVLTTFLAIVPISSRQIPGLYLEFWIYY